MPKTLLDVNRAQAWEAIMCLIGEIQGRTSGAYVIEGEHGRVHMRGTVAGGDRAAYGITADDSVAVRCILSLAAGVAFEERIDKKGRRSSRPVGGHVCSLAEAEAILMQAIEGLDGMRRACRLLKESSGKVVTGKVRVDSYRDRKKAAGLCIDGGCDVAPTRGLRCEMHAERARLITADRTAHRLELASRSEADDAIVF